MKTTEKIFIGTKPISYHIMGVGNKLTGHFVEHPYIIIRDTNDFQVCAGFMPEEYAKIIVKAINES